MFATRETFFIKIKKINLRQGLNYLVYAIMGMLTNLRYVI